MYRNAGTGKGWSRDEETAFEQLMRAGDLERLSAIRLWKRCRMDLSKALRLTKETYAFTPAQQERNRVSAVRLAGIRQRTSTEVSAVA